MMVICCSCDEDIKDDFYPWKIYIKNDFYPWKRYIKDDFYPGFDI